MKRLIIIITVLFLSYLAASVFGVADSNLVAHYRLDDNTLSTAVIDEKGTNGIFAGTDPNTSAHHTTGRVGGALTFNGTSDYILVPNAISLNFGTGDFSICFWFQTNDITKDDQMVLDKYPSLGTPGYQLICEGNVGNTACQMNLILKINQPPDGVTTIEGTPFSDAGWHFICFTCDRNGNGISYLDGITGTPIDISAFGVSLTNTQDLYIGDYHPQLGNDTIDGSLDNIMIFNKALSVTEIQQIYSQGITRRWL